MNLAEIMDDLAGALDTIEGLRVFPYWADRITPPAAVVQWPEEYNFDATYGRGSDRITVPVTVLTGKIDARSARNVLAAYADGSGTFSVKATLEAGTYTAFDSLRVVSVEFEVMTVASVDYLAGRFNIDIIGTGA